MRTGIREVFCSQCRKETEFALKKTLITKNIRDKEYQFTITTAVCLSCGEEINVPGLIDKNVAEIDAQYRNSEDIVSVDDIERMLKIYNLGKAPGSLALGFGEITLTRYLSGQVPSKEYSDIIRNALTSPAFMEKMLKENRDKIGNTAYKKAMNAAKSLESLFSVSDKMLRVIAYVFDVLEEVTPLMLQKLLYYIQGVYSALYGRAMFTEDCRAWVHGPVYTEVYDLFKGFKYNPIDDARFAILEGNAYELTDDEREVIDLVLNTFGMYGGKALERITHKEEPWLNARVGYCDDIPSNEIITKDAIKKYFESIDKQYNIRSEDGLNKYIAEMMSA